MNLLGGYLAVVMAMSVHHFGQSATLPKYNLTNSLVYVHCLDFFLNFIFWMRDFFLFIDRPHSFHTYTDTGGSNTTAEHSPSSFKNLKISNTFCLVCNIRQRSNKVIDGSYSTKCLKLEIEELLSSGNTRKLFVCCLPLFFLSF